MKKKKNILIHPDRIEDLDRRNERLERNRKEPVSTGYITTCRLRNTRHHHDLLLPASFVRNKITTGCCIIFKVLGKDEMMLQPVPPKYINRTSICHVHRRFFSMFQRYAFRIPLDAVPEPCAILHGLNLDPLLTSYRFQLAEYRIMDDAEGELMAYKFIPVSPF